MSPSTAIPSAGRHGGDGPAIAQALGWPSEAILDLSQTLNPFAPDITTVTAPLLGVLSAYPDPASATYLLAEAIGVDPARLLLTNGGSEAIALVRRVIGGTVASEPEFGLHPRDGHGPIWRSDPHSPSGELAPTDAQADVWDEAFFAMATGRWSHHRTGITVGSLTKLFACPGLRIGYVIDDDVHRFEQVQPQWSVNSLALAALPALLAAADLSGWARSIAEARAATEAVFASRGFVVRSADAPWILVEAPGLRDRLIPFGIVVRDCTNFGLPTEVRVAATDEAGRARLGDALDRLADR